MTPVDTPVEMLAAPSATTSSLTLPTVLAVAAGQDQAGAEPAKPVTCSPPKQAFGPPWGPDYGVRQICDAADDEVSYVSQHSTRAGTPSNHSQAAEDFSQQQQQQQQHLAWQVPNARAFRDMSGEQQQHQQQQQLQHRHPLLQQPFGRLPTPFSEGEISPTTRVSFSPETGPFGAFGA
ncbi:hypothetical protein KEM52_001212 [Ascosphaera acerosa]|nr:hypothetical protein KEM52_001212 [Ascosphaera acerosa]